MTKKVYYLDSNAHLSLNSAAIKTFIDFQNEPANHGHSSALSSPGRLASGIIEKSRKQIAKLIGAKTPSQIIFTSSCTSACEWTINIFQNQFKQETKGNLYYNPIEHPAVSDNCNDLIKLNIDSNGKILTNITEDDYLITTKLHNELGIIYEPSNYKAILMDYSQAAGKINVNVTKDNVDIAVFGAHKFGGPVNVGFIYLRNSDWWLPFGNGSRYFLDRAGTMDVLGIKMAAAALEEANQTLDSRTKNMQSFQQVIESHMEKSGFEIVGKNLPRSPSTSFIYVPNMAMQLLMGLDSQKIYIGLGSACGALHTGTSKTIKELNRPGTNHDYIRISNYGEYDDKDALVVCKAIDKILKVK